MNIEGISKIARKAALRSAEFYSEMAGGDSIHEAAIETFASSRIANEIFKRNQPICVKLEATFNRIRLDSGAERRGRPNFTLRDRSRFDAVCYYDGKPKGLIEVKKSIRPSRNEADVVRVSEATHRFGAAFGGSVEFGLVIAIQRLFEGARNGPKDRALKFQDSFNWGIEPKIEWDCKYGNYGTSRGGRAVIGLCAYTILFRS